LLKSLPVDASLLRKCQPVSLYNIEKLFLKHYFSFFKKDISCWLELLNQLPSMIPNNNGSANDTCTQLVLGLFLI
jgi:hypothetical protein